MSLLLRDVVIEKLQKKSDTHYIQRVQGLADDKKVTITKWRNTGRIMKRKDYLDHYHKEDLASHDFGLMIHDDASDICRYAGGFVVQFLKDNTYLFRYGQYQVNDKSIKKVEKQLFEWAKPFIV